MSEPQDRCGGTKRHHPHWHKPEARELWCDGKAPYNPDKAAR